jgi:hypothetical protein
MEFSLLKKKVFKKVKFIENEVAQMENSIASLNGYKIVQHGAK